MAPNFKSAPLMRIQFYTTCIKDLGPLAAGPPRKYRVLFQEGRTRDKKRHPSGGEENRTVTSQDNNEVVTEL